MAKRSNVHLLPGSIEAQARQNNHEARRYVARVLAPSVRRALTQVERLGQMPGHVDAVTGYPRALAAALNFLAAVYDLEYQLGATGAGYASEDR